MHNHLNFVKEDEPKNGGSKVTKHPLGLSSAF